MNLRGNRVHRKRWMGRGGGRNEANIVLLHYQKLHLKKDNYFHLNVNQHYDS